MSNQWSEKLQNEIIESLEGVVIANKANGHIQPCWAGKLLDKMESPPKGTQTTWTSEQQERIMQLVDYCIEMTSGYLSGWAKTLKVDLAVQGHLIPEPGTTWTTTLSSHDDEIVKLLERILAVLEHE